jgi:hypothetical protein
METQYNFIEKYIECETWAQVLRLAALSKEQGYKHFVQDKSHFDNGNTVFYTYLDDREVKRPFGSAICHIASVGEKETIKYADFIHPQSVKKVTSCKGCPLYTRLEMHDYQYCSYPNKEMATQLRVDMFANCPLKEKALTIEIG